MKRLSICYLLLLCFSCQMKERPLMYQMKETNDSLDFNISSESTTFIKSMSIFEDGDNTCFAYLNNDENILYVYDIQTQRLIKEILFQQEGPDGTGPKAAGFYMQDWDSIYIPNIYVPEISVIDSCGRKSVSFKLDSLNKGYNFIPTRSVINFPFLLIGEHLYGLQLPNPMLGEEVKSKSPVELRLDLKNMKSEPLPFHYPSTVMRNHGKPQLGIETNVSRCFNGEVLVYSFAFDDNLYVVSLEGKVLDVQNVKSRYVDNVSLPDNVSPDMQTAVRKMCELPFYGNIIYDKYRKVYYRIVYPQTEYNNVENFVDMWQFGRSLFSIMILDEDFNAVGETLFPENEFRSDLMFVLEDGLYISSSHYKNPIYDEDRLVFKRFVLEKSNSN